MDISKVSSKRPPCFYWGLGKCLKDKSCPYSHSKHPKTDVTPFSYDKKMVRPRVYAVRRSRSPGPYGRKSRSPIRYGRRSRSPRRYSRSPKRYSRSPRRYSRSPKRYSRSPQRYSRSPRRYSRSPRRYSRSPRRYSRSPKRSSRSPGRFSDRYRPSPGNKQNETAWREGNSPMPPPDDILCRTISTGMESLSSAPAVPCDDMYDNLICSPSEELDKQNSNQTDNRNTSPDTKLEHRITQAINSPSNGSPRKQNTESTKKISEEYSNGAPLDDEVGDGSLYSDFSPSRALDIIKGLPKDFFNFPFKTKDGNMYTEDVDGKNDTKEAGSYMSPLEKPETFLPPVTRHDDECFKAVLPMPHKLLPMNNAPARRDMMWTPAMDRNKMKHFVAPMISPWEVDTPYISRNTAQPLPGPSDVPKPVVTKKKERKDSPESKRKSSDSRKKKKRRRKRSSSSSSSSDSEDSSAQKPDTGENLLSKKKTILTKVWALMEQKKKLDAQRSDIILHHKPDEKNLPEILHENASLSKEIDKQIFVMNDMIQKINHGLGISMMDNHQQEFYLRSNLLRDDTDTSGIKKLSAPKFPVLDQSEKLSYAGKFLKPSEARRHEDERKPKKHEEKYQQKKPKERAKEELQKKKIKKEHSKDKSRQESTKPKSWQEAFKEVKKDKTVESSAKEIRLKRSNSNEEYAPSANMKPHVVYIDQGMHWCVLCNEFLDSVSGYVKHLQSASHFKKLSNDKKKWLPKYTLIEKEKTQNDAPILTIPLQGVEFLHSLTGYYCSMCDLLLKTSEEAGEHAETKIHVSKYKDYLSKNPMYETSYIKDKMAAFAKYSVEKEKEKLKSKDTFFRKRGETIPPLSKIGPKVTKQEPVPYTAEPKPVFPVLKEPTPPITTEVKKLEIIALPPALAKEPIMLLDNNPSLEVAKVLSIRVASRVSKSVEEKHNVKNESSISQAEEIVNSPLQKSEKEISNPLQTLKEDDSKLNTLRKKVGLAEAGANSTKKLGIKSFSNVMIGKMPFLKRNRRELVITKNKPELLKVNDKATKTVSVDAILPQIKPKNVDYITEIESCGTKTKFTKVIGPTFPDDNDSSDMEIDSTSSPVPEVETPPSTAHFDSNNTNLTDSMAAESMEQGYYHQHTPPVLPQYTMPPPSMSYQTMSHPQPYMGPMMHPYYSSNQYNMMEAYPSQFPILPPYKAAAQPPYKTSTSPPYKASTPPPYRASTPPPPGTEITNSSLSSSKVHNVKANLQSVTTPNLGTTNIKSYTPPVIDNESLPTEVGQSYTTVADLKEDKSTHIGEKDSYIEVDDSATPAKFDLKVHEVNIEDQDLKDAKSKDIEQKLTVIEDNSAKVFIRKSVSQVDGVESKNSHFNAPCSAKLAMNDVLEEENTIKKATERGAVISAKQTFINIGVGFEDNITGISSKSDSPKLPIKETIVQENNAELYSSESEIGGSSKLNLKGYIDSKEIASSAELNLTGAESKEWKGEEQTSKLDSSGLPILTIKKIIFPVDNDEENSSQCEVDGASNLTLHDIVFEEQNKQFDKFINTDLTQRYIGSNFDLHAISSAEWTPKEIGSFKEHTEEISEFKPSKLSSKVGLLERNTAESDGISCTKLTLKEAIIQEENARTISERETCSTSVFTSLSQELCNLEKLFIPTFECQEIHNDTTTLNETEVILPNEPTDNETSSIEETDHEKQILEGLQLLVGAESSDDSGDEI